jgi:hypothetical protein
MTTKLIISALAFLAITTIASAQNNGTQNRQRDFTGKGIAYVDANKNGICDNFENSVSTNSPRKRLGNGKCCGMRQGQRGMGRGMGQGQGRRLNFVDANKNGICDYNEAHAKK